MAEDGEWTRQNATLSEVTAQKEYSISREFIIKGIKTGKLEYRDGVIWGNPYLRILRRQVEAYVVSELGSDFLNITKHKAELRKVKSEITSLTRKLKVAQTRKNELEILLEKANNIEQAAIAGQSNHGITVIDPVKKGDR
jgi:hypothetical protein